MRKVLFLNRVYPPAAGASGQLLAELASRLAQEGWQVTVLTGSVMGSPRSEMMEGVRVERAGPPFFTRAGHWRRAFCYLSLYPAFLWRALRLPRADVVVTMTDPPLVLALGPLLKKIKGSRLVHSAQDIYPEVAEELGVIAKGGWLATACRAISTWALRRNDRIILIGRCMRYWFLRRGLSAEGLRLIPNWAVAVRPIEGENPFRRAHDLEGRFTVMYSGNFGLAHSFEAMLDAAAILHDSRPEILFLFIGTGPQWAAIREQAAARRLGNTRFLPPQPVEALSQSLGGADLHLISMKASVCGLVVPSKLYGILAAGRPTVFLGPRESETAHVLEEHGCGTVLEEADGPALARCLEEWATDPTRLETAGRNALAAANCFSLERTAAAFQEILRETLPLF